MSNIRVLILYVTITLTLLPISAHNFEVHWDGFYIVFNVLDEESSTCATYQVWADELPDGADTSDTPHVFTLPEKVEDGDKTYTVTAIGAESFYKCTLFEEIELPESVTTIEESAFMESSLSKIVLPSSVSTVPKYAFAGCINLEDCNLSAITTIERGGFDACWSLTNIGGLDNAESIELNAFRSCRKIRSVNIPKVTQMGRRAFFDCSGITELNLPAGLPAIDRECFSGCSALVSVDIPDGINTIEMSAFKGCSALEDVSIPQSVMSIERDAFADCESIKTLSVNRETPPLAYLSAFSSATYSKAKLIVPEGCEENYRTYGIWQFFEHMETGVEEVSENKSPTAVARYTLDGVAVDSSYKGLVIVRYADGSARKVVVK